MDDLLRTLDAALGIWLTVALLVAAVVVGAVVVLWIIA